VIGILGRLTAQHLGRVADLIGASNGRLSRCHDACPPVAARPDRRLRSLVFPHHPARRSRDGDLKKG